MTVGGQQITSTIKPELEITRTGARGNAPGMKALEEFKRTGEAKNAMKSIKYGKYAALGGTGLLAGGLVLKGMANNKKQ